MKNRLTNAQKEGIAMGIGGVVCIIGMILTCTTDAWWPLAIIMGGVCLPCCFYWAVLDGTSDDED